LRFLFLGYFDQPLKNLFFISEKTYVGIRKWLNFNHRINAKLCINANEEENEDEYR
jgi:hypothetical protein